MMMRGAPGRPRPTVNMPVTPPVRKATLSAPFSDPDLAAAAVRTLPRTARLMPMKPVRPDRLAPARKAVVLKMPDGRQASTGVLEAWLTTLLDGTNTRTASGTQLSGLD